MNPFQFKIPGRQRKCTACQDPFKDRSQVFSTVEGEEDEPIRKDYCQACFDPKSLNESIWGHWHSIVKKEAMQQSPDQKAMDLFKEVYQTNDKEYLFFIAGYLKRKKQLLVRNEIKKENMVFFEDPKTSEVYALVNSTIAPSLLNTFKERLIEELKEEVLDF